MDTNVDANKIYTSMVNSVRYRKNRSMNISVILIIYFRIIYYIYVRQTAPHFLTWLKQLVFHKGPVTTSTISEANHIQ